VPAETAREEREKTSKGIGLARSFPLLQQVVGRGPGRKGERGKREKKNTTTEY